MENSYILPTVVSIIVALLGFLSGLWAWKKNKSDAAESLITSALAMVHQYETAVDDCKDTSKALAEEAKLLSDLAVRLEKRAVEAEARVSEIEKVVTELLTRLDKSETERIELTRQLATLEMQLESLAFVPKNKLRRRASDLEKEEKKDDTVE
jgi:chromosome segregation ATPase